jgi:hypothetical protein
MSEFWLYCGMSNTIAKFDPSGFVVLNIPILLTNMDLSNNYYLFIFLKSVLPNFLY